MRGSGLRHCWLNNMDAPLGWRVDDIARLPRDLRC